MLHRFHQTAFTALPIKVGKGLAVTLSLLFVMCANNVMAQSSPGLNVTLSASVVAPASAALSGGVDNAGSLDFGLVVSNTTASIDPNTSPDAGMCTISGGAGMSMTVTYTSPSVTLSDGSGNELTFTPVVVGSQSQSSQSSAPSVLSGSSIVLNSSGQFSLWLGGSATVPRGQSPGTYTGTFSLTISY